MSIALTIAGADPTGGAGIQADIKTFEAFGVMGLSAITALTAQDGNAVASTRPVSPAFLKEQISVLCKKFKIDAMKIGMLGTAKNARAVTELIKEYRLKNIVLDTVLRSTGGYPLIKGDGIKAIKEMLAFVTIATPNLHEASMISGIGIKDTEGMEEAAKAIADFGPRYVLLKGGHLKTDPVDILYDGKKFEYFHGKRLKGDAERLHGTGCILSAGIAAGLAKGGSAEKAVEGAREFLMRVLKGRR